MSESDSFFLTLFILTVVGTLGYLFYRMDDCIHCGAPPHKQKYLGVMPKSDDDHSEKTYLLYKCTECGGENKRERNFNSVSGGGGG